MKLIMESWHTLSIVYHCDLFCLSRIHDALLHEPSRFHFSVFEPKGGELYSGYSAELAGPAQCVSMDVDVDVG